MNKGILAVIFSVFMLVGLAACEDEGPMERAGENIDDAANDLERNMEDAGDEIEDEFN